MAIQLRKRFHGTEIADIPGLPRSLQESAMEALAVTMARPFRGYTDWAVEQILALQKTGHHRRIVELAAGQAPLSQSLALHSSDDLLLIPCDLTPPKEWYRTLAQRFPDRITPLESSVDLLSLTTESLPAGDDVLFVISTAFHHIPPDARSRVLRNLSELGDVVILEPLSRNWPSLLLALLGAFPCLAAPLFLFRRSGTFRRVWWSYIIPLVPFILTYDGIVTVLRNWNRAEWLHALAEFGERARFERGLLSYKVTISRVRVPPSKRPHP